MSSDATETNETQQNEKFNEEEPKEYGLAQEEEPSDKENIKLSLEPVDPSDPEASKKVTKYVSSYKPDQLDEKQKKIFEELKKKVFEGILEKKIATEEQIEQLKKTEVLNDWCFYRFLYGWGFKIEKAHPYMERMVEWNLKFQPEKIRLDDLKPVSQSGFLFDYGYDRFNRPIIFIHLAMDKTKNDKAGKELKFRHLVYSLENCVRRMSKNVYQATWVVELKKGSFSLGLVKSLKYMFDLIGDYYPERAGRIIVLNPPFITHLAVAFVRPFLTLEQQRKYIFITGKPADLKKKLLNYVPEDQLPTWFYGNSDFKFEYEELKKREAEICS